VDFVDDVDLLAALIGREVDLIAQVAHVFHAGVGSGVDLYQVEEGASVHAPAVVAFVTRAFGEVFIQTVDGFSEYTGNGGFPGAARPGKKKGMPFAPGGDGVAQRLDDVLLADDLFPAAGPPFSV